MLQVEQLIQRVKAYQPSVDPELIQRAYDYSFRMHAGQVRKSGQPYIVHPVGVAGILAEASERVVLGIGINVGGTIWPGAGWVERERLELLVDVLERLERGYGEWLSR